VLAQAVVVRVLDLGCFIDDAFLCKEAGDSPFHAVACPADESHLTLQAIGGWTFAVLNPSTCCRMATSVGRHSMPEAPKKPTTLSVCS
jgi:hypothetical protein